MIPEELAGTYVTEAARFRAARPDLEGLVPCCGHCVHVSREAIGTHADCALDGIVRSTMSDCGNGGFTYDARPLWEQYPWTTKAEWTRKDGMLVATEMAFAEHVAQGGTMDELPTLRVGGKRLVFPPPSKATPLNDAAFSEDPYGLLPDAQSVKGKLAAMQAEREAKAKGAV